MQLIQKQILITLAYVLAGIVALSLSIPPGLASPLFPAAGIALAAVLVMGKRAVPSVFFGCALVNLYIYWDTAQSTNWPAILVLSVAATLQALFGSWLIRRYVGVSPRLDSFREYFRFAILAGPLACLLSTSMANLFLVGSGVLPPEAFFLNWWGWWLGDSVGVLVAAPIALAFLGQPRKVWAPRRYSVALPLTIVIALTTWAVANVVGWEKQRHQAGFEREAGYFAQSLIARFDSHLHALFAMQGLIHLDPDISREEFHDLSKPWLETQPSLQALGWSTHLSPGELDDFEQRIQRSGRPDYRVFNRDAQHTRPSSDQELVVITYVEPEATNKLALGVNTLSVDVPRLAVLQAARVHEPVASGGFRLAQETGDQLGLVLYMAVRGGVVTMPLDQTTAFRGVVFATIRLQDAIDDATGTTLAHGLEACLLDVTPGAPVIQLAGPSDCTSEDFSGTMRFDHNFAFASRSWMVRIIAREGFGPTRDGFSAWLFAGVSLLTIVLLSVLLLSISGRTRRTQTLVDERTKELTAEVAERKAKEMALSESENRFRKVFDTASVGLAYCDLDGVILRANPQFRRIVGRSEDQLIGMLARDITHPDDQQLDRDNYARLISGEVNQIERKKRYLLPDGSIVPVHTRLSLECDAFGKPLHVVAVVQDIREREQLHEAERAREVAEAANRAKDEFLSSMSHELRTPLNAILGYAQLLTLDRRESLSDDQAERIEQIQKAGWYLLEMINDVLDLSRMESGAMHIVAENVDINALAQECLAMFKEQCQQAEINIQFDLQPEAAFVCGDTTRLKQVLNNIFSNAVKYNIRGGSINVQTRRHDRHVFVRITDSGLGMNEAQLAKLYEPFNRLGRENSSTEGTGIGLVVARRLVQLMGGTIEVESTPNAGSSFTIQLPVADGESVAQSKKVQRHKELAANDCQGIIYCIEDNLTNAAVIRGFLSHRPGIELQLFTHGEAGLKAIESAPPKLLLLDIDLPDISGVEVIRRIRSNPDLAGLVIIVLSAGAMQKQIEEAMAAGANDYLTKPLVAAELLARVDRILCSEQP
jgi:PAS domain S-box-containing protein